MKKNTLVFASLVSAVLALSACGGGSSDGPELTAAPVEPATAASKPAVDEPARSPRGNLIKKVGEPAGYRLAAGSDEWALNFTITGIETDPVCSHLINPAENGRLIAISIEASTAPEPEFSQKLQPGISFGSYGWKAIASNGTTVNTVATTAAINCLTAADAIPTIGAGEKAAGKVVLDIPEGPTTLVFTLGGGYDSWEWEFPTK